VANWYSGGDRQVIQASATTTPSVGVQISSALMASRNDSIGPVLNVMHSITNIVVIPFFSGSNGLNSNHLLREIGRRIRDLRSS
jgi:hypothetical protein